MKYETPELTALISPINAIQDSDGTQKENSHTDAITGAQNDGPVGAYQDWE